MKMRIFWILATALAGSGCSTLAPGVFVGDERLDYEPADQNVLENIEVRRITPQLIIDLENKEKEALGSAINLSGYQYRVGPQDVLNIIVWEHPELTIPAGEFRDPELVGHRVSPQGTIFYPYVGEIKVSGKTTEQIRGELTELLKTHIPDPQLDVRVVAYRSQKVLVTGEVKTPGELPITDEPLTVTRAIALAGGKTEKADLSNVQLIRKSNRASLDIQALYDAGDLSNDRALANGDIINVPDSMKNRVFVMGETKTQPALVMHQRHMTLAEAIGEAGGLEQRYADARRAFVIRAADRDLRPEVYHVNLNSPDGMVLTSRFMLKPLDVVYIATSDVTRWERIVSQLLPTFRLYDMFYTP